MRIGVLNPLPGVLAHFNRALVDNLSSIEDLTVVQLTVSGTEMTSGSKALDRVRSAFRFTREVRREMKQADVDCVVNLWPTFGYLEALVWRILPTGVPVWTILHDVKPLRTQFGYWPRAIAPLRLGSVGAHGWLVHTESAAAAAVELGLKRTVLIPHPILPDQPQCRESSNRVLVFGQFKPSRDTDLLVRLGPALRDAGYAPHIVGRGWPELEGWECDDRFVDEASVSEILRDAAVVIIPYRRYYQSGVAVRAIESGTPVVGIRTDFLEEYFGIEWAGLVQPGNDAIDEWVNAVEKASAVSSDDLHARARRSRSDVINRWRRALSEEICVKKLDQ